MFCNRRKDEGGGGLRAIQGPSATCRQNWGTTGLTSRSPPEVGCRAIKEWAAGQGRAEVPPEEYVGGPVRGPGVSRGVGEVPVNAEEHGRYFGGKQLSWRQELRGCF